GTGSCYRKGHKILNLILVIGRRIMKNHRSSKFGLLLTAVIAVSVFAIACGEKKKENDGWGSYKADPKSTSYSSLDQINLSNVSQLENAFTFQMSDLTHEEDPVSSQSNPIIIDGVMYAKSGKQTVYAIEAATGKEIWSFNSLAEGMPSAASRGVTYWESGDDKRILYS